MWKKTSPIVVREDASDRDLLRYTVEGSREAFDLLIERFRHRLVSFAWRLVGDRDLAEDVAQEALLRAYRSCARYNGQAEVSTWLFTIARNLCLNARRDRARHPASSLSSNRDGSSTDLPNTTTEQPDAALHRAELAKAINEAVESLPERQRTALVLAKYEKMPYEEIAKVMGTSVGAVKLCVYRAREALREKLQAFWNP